MEGYFVFLEFDYFNMKILCLIFYNVINNFVKLELLDFHVKI